MSKETKIQWTDSTWNPFYGCKKVSAECKFCYMFRDLNRYGRNPNVVTKSKTKFSEPLKWKEPKRIFTCSWSDWFIEDADQWRDELWRTVKQTPQHTYLILTKRPERIKQCLPNDWGDGYDNVWLGVTAGINESLERCEILGKIPAKVKFISAEPLLEELTELDSVFSKYKYDWIILGGESGNDNGKFRYRECKMEWIKSAIEVSEKHGVKVFVKQLGTHLSKELSLKDRHGGNIDEWPQEFRIREFPNQLNEKTKMKKQENNNNRMNDSRIESLSPFKKQIAELLIAGEDREQLTTRLASERKMPRRTAQAYVTMVVKYLNNKSIPSQNSNYKMDMASSLDALQEKIALSLFRGESAKSITTNISKEYEKSASEVKEFISHTKRIILNNLFNNI